MRKWKCTKTDGCSEKYINVGDIFITDDNGCNFKWKNGEKAYCNINSYGIIGYEFIELIKEEGENKMEDLRELIKPCYIIKMRDETWCVAIKEANDLGFYKISKTDMIGISSISSYNELLNNKNDDVYDIVEIREYVPCILFSYENAKLVWEREEKSHQQLEIESIEADMRKLADRLNELKEK